VKARKTFKYRLYPTTAQADKLTWALDRCRELYNAGLQERREAYRMCGVSVGYLQQQNQLPAIKEDRPEYKQIGSQVLQDVLRRLDKAFAAFFRRVKEGHPKPGYPRFKGRYRYNSLTFTQAGWKMDTRLHLSGVGALRVKMHRPIEGVVKTVTIKRDVDHWYVMFSCEVDVKPGPIQDKPAVGIDMGLEYYATMSDGTHIENPRYYRKMQATLARRQRVMERRGKGGKNRGKAGVLVRKAHRKIANQRTDMQHKAARRIIETYGAVAVEDLNIAGMVQNHHLAKSISDAAWGQFIAILRSKAASAGSLVIAVNPSGTSQLCSGCGAAPERPKTLADRWHTCMACGLSIQRDVNSACNILGRAGLARQAA